MSIVKENRRLWWDVVTGVCVVVIVFATAVKIFSGDVKFSVDFPTLLSLLLALFSVGLSALFYFKATESSNSFYDNTYKFTTDISLILTRMDSGLSEKMKLLESRYGDLKDYMRSGSYSAADSEATTDQLSQEKAELEKVVSEKDIIIAQLIESSTLGETEKNDIREELEVKNNRIKELLAEVELLRSKRDWNQFNKAAHDFDADMDSKFSAPSRVVRYARDVALKRLGASPAELLSFSRFSRLFSAKSKYLNESFLRDLEKLGFVVDGEITMPGHNFFLALSL